MISHSISDQCKSLAQEEAIRVASDFIFSFPPWLQTWRGASPSVTNFTPRRAS